VTQQNKSFEGNAVWHSLLLCLMVKYKQYEI